jgi:hypothetical protein
MAQAEGHAFIVHTQHEPAGPLGRLGPGSAVGPFPTAPLGSDGGWVVASAVLLAARIGRITVQEARMDVRKLQVRFLEGWTAAFSRTASCRGVTW